MDDALNNQEFSLSKITLSYFAKDLKSLNQSMKPTEYKFILDPNDGKNIAGTFRINACDEYLVKRPSYVKLFTEHPSIHKSFGASYLAVAMRVDTEDFSIRYATNKLNPFFPMKKASFQIYTCLVTPWIFYILYEISDMEDQISIIKSVDVDLDSQRHITYLNFIDGIFSPIINN